MRIVMVMSIARPIKAGKIGPKTAGNQRKASKARLNNKRPSQPKPKCKSPGNGRPSNSTAATRIGSAVTSGPEVITVLGGIAEDGAVAVGAEEAVDGSSVLREMIRMQTKKMYSWFFELPD
jgi:hypothetical protein